MFFLHGWFEGHTLQATERIEMSAVIVKAIVGFYRLKLDRRECRMPIKSDF